MKNFCLIGSFDKWDWILYLSKIIKKMGKEVLVIDATKEQKARYIVPFVQPTKSYITRFEEIDIAIGFESYEEIERYVGSIEEKKMKYDYALVNVDNPELFLNFHNEDTVKSYFVTSLELYAIRKGLETIQEIKQPIPITKVVFSREMNEHDNDYIDYLSLGYKVMWEEDAIAFPYDTQNLECMMENEKRSKISMKGLTQTYKDSLEYMILQMIPNIDLAQVRKITKKLEKEG